MSRAPNMVIKDAKHGLNRNRGIARAGDILIACPRQRYEIIRSSTAYDRSRHDRTSWDQVSTLRVARDLASLISSGSRALTGGGEPLSQEAIGAVPERQVKPRRVDDVTRMALVALSRFVDWRRLLTIVKPDTLLRWHRKDFKLVWRWKSRRPARPATPAASVNSDHGRREPDLG